MWNLVLCVGFGGFLLHRFEHYFFGEIVGLKGIVRMDGLRFIKMGGHVWYDQSVS